MNRCVGLAREPSPGGRRPGGPRLLDDGVPPGGRCRLLGIFAHPDDETFCAGGTFARYAGQGAEIMVVSATRGQAGQIRDAAAGTRRTIAAVREAELRLACERLGITKVRCLDHVDGTLPDAGFPALVDEVAEVICEFRPDVVITFGPDGGYGHPDHIHAHRATVAAVRDVDQVRKLYFTARTDAFRRRMQRVQDKLVVSAEGAAKPPLRTPATATAAITTVVDTFSTLVRRRAALASHRSQLDGTHWLDMPDADFAALFDTETYVRVLDTTGTPVPETDLFGGCADISRT